MGGYHERLIRGLTPGYGAMAILIAVLGRLNPGVGVASVLVAILMVDPTRCSAASGSGRRRLRFQAIVVLLRAPGGGALGPERILRIDAARARSFRGVHLVLGELNQPGDEDKPANEGRASPRSSVG